jgi:hypothetical protein
MIRKILECRLEEPDLGGRAQGKVFLFASFSANSFISSTVVPNTPDRMLSICAIRFEMYLFIRAFSRLKKD